MVIGPKAGFPITIAITITDCTVVLRGSRATENAEDGPLSLAATAFQAFKKELFLAISCQPIAFDLKALKSASDTRLD
jgi:hypothetical protein